MWEIKKEELLNAVKAMETMENHLAELENQFGSRIIDSIDIDDPKFKEGYDIDLVELDNNISRLRELISQYIKEEDEYYENQ